MSVRTIPPCGDDDGTPENGIACDLPRGHSGLHEAHDEAGELVTDWGPLDGGQKTEHPDSVWSAIVGEGSWDDVKHPVPFFTPEQRAEFDRTVREVDAWLCNAVEDGFRCDRAPGHDGFHEQHGENGDLEADWGFWTDNSVVTIGEDGEEVRLNPPPYRAVKASVAPKSQRAELLDEANSLVNGDRNATYGPPHQDFQRTADILTALGFQAASGDIRAHHVAMILAAVKLSRLTWSPDKRDSWVDLAGYAACGHEAYELTKENDDDD